MPTDHETRRELKGAIARRMNGERSDGSDGAGVITETPSTNHQTPENHQAPILVGRGILTWHRSERVSDRYGSVFLIPDGCNSSTTEPVEAVPLKFPKPGEEGSLYALVIDPRESTHIGDFFRGLYPITPKAGDRLLLGTGAAWVHVEDGYRALCVEPEDRDRSDWLNPRALYNCHESLVELIWEPK